MTRPIDPHTPPPPTELRARELSNEQLASLDHVEWLENFAKITLLPSKVPMTPRRLGVGTRLTWAARYIKLLQETTKAQEEEHIALTKRLAEADKLLADAVAQIRRLKHERDELERQLGEAI